MNLNIVLIHSTGGNPDECWYPWLKRELEKLGCEVIAPLFPTPEGQTLDNWMKVFEPCLDKVNENTVFIGRSIGPAFILRVLEKLDKPVKATFMVAGFCSDIGLPDFKPYVDSFIDKPFNWEKIKNNCKKFYVYNSDNDPYIPLGLGQELADNLESNLILIKGGGHFNLDTSYAEKFERVLDDIKSIEN